MVWIEDPQSGSEGYTFDITWAYGRPSYQPPPPPPTGPDLDRDLDDWRRNRDQWARREDWRSRLFERVRDDVDHVQRVTWPGGSDQYRLDRVKQELNELQGQYASGRWDDRELDDVIRALDRVVDDNRMAPRDRDVLRDDLGRLRKLRDRRR